jgi:lipopolysaccharide transport system ATP-binding protein
MTSRDQPLVRVDHLAKKFCRSLRRSLWYGLRDLGGEVLGESGADRLHLRPGEFLAVDDVSFDLRRGECLGLIGANGAGKSTLLKMLNGLIRPDGGRIAISGRVGALIELGAGFNPVLTGRENVYVNGAVLGLTKREIDQKFDQIVDYAELWDAIDTPVQSYSSGMRVRLGFAVAAFVEPDVLLIDEVLAVGDMTFVLKCFKTLEEKLERTAIVFVSHQMAQVARTCTRVIVLDHGRVAADGTASDSIDAYLSRLAVPTGSFVGTDGARIDQVEFVGAGGGAGEGAPFRIGHLDDLELDLRLRIPARYPRAVLYVALYDRELRGVGETQQLDSDALHNTGAPIAVRITLPRLNLSKGVYSVDLAIKSEERGGVIARFRSVAVFQVTADQVAWMPVHFESRFEQLH